MENTNNTLQESVKSCNYVFTYCPYKACRFYDFNKYKYICSLEGNGCCVETGYNKNNKGE